MSKKQKEVIEGLNILLVGNGDNIEYILASKYLKRLYTTSTKKYSNVVNINFITFRELAQKCKALQIDLVIVEDKRWINEGVADVMKKFFVNCIAPTAKWTQLSISESFISEMMTKYNFNTPPKMLFPSEFPVIIKGNGFSKKANSLQDVTLIRKTIYERSEEVAKNLHIEKFLDGEKIIITSLFDGKNLLTFPVSNLDKTILEEYSQKLKNMLIKEKAEFIAFIHSEVILYENKLYNIGFRFEFRQSACNLDILYVLWLAVFQKLNEISF